MNITEVTPERVQQIRAHGINKWAPIYQRLEELGAFETDELPESFYVSAYQKYKGRFHYRKISPNRWEVWLDDVPATNDQSGN